MGVRFTTLKTADQMTRYYIKRNNLEAYYCENQEFNGYWGGQAAKMLGLDKFISDEAFTRLSHNLHPLTGEQLTDRMRKDRRPGFDLTFDVPKSVSLAYAYSKDDRIIQLVRHCVKGTMAEAEPAASARVRAGLEKDADKDRPTGNFCYAEIIHLVARPENGYSDPHVHIHIVVMNLTFDREEKKWKALQMGDIHKEIQTYQGSFHRRLKEGLEKLGLEIEPSEHLYEVKGIPQDLNQIFSRRTRTIEATAERLGITDPAQKAKLGAMTRERKDNNLPITELEPFWWGGLSPEHRAALEEVKTRLQRSLAQELSSQMVAPTPGQAVGKHSELFGTFDRPLKPREAEAASESLGTRKQLQAGFGARPRSINQRTEPGTAAEKVNAPTEHDYRAVALAMKHLFARESAVTEMRLLGEAFNCWCCDKATRTGIIQAVAEAPLVRKERDGKIYVTTAEIYAEELRLADFCIRGKDRFEPLNEAWEVRNDRLNEGQRGAALLALTSRDFITGISGVAGGGKTTVMREIKSGIEAAGYRVVVLAPLAATARETLRKDGFENATTIAKFLKSETMQNEARGAVLMVDEAGLISTRLANSFFAVAEELGARVILVGDTGQHHSVDRGQAFDHLRKRGKMTVADVTEILRQQGPYKQFVEMFVAGECRRAIISLWSMDAMVVQPLAELAQTVANDYVDAIQRGETVMVVSPTHAEGDILTEAIRAKLKERNLLGKSGKRERLRDLEWLDEQKARPESYRRGMVVQFNGRVAGFELGERVEVIDVRDDVVRVRAGVGQHAAIKPMPLHEAEKFQVYGRECAEVVQWETLRNLGWTDAQKSDPDHYEMGQVIQINDHIKGFALGEEMEVIGVSDDMVRVRSHSNSVKTQIKALPLSQPKAFEVYKRKTIEMCEGEKIRITGNGYTADNYRLNNGSQYRVDHLSPNGELVLDNGRRIEKTFPHISHGYVPTSYAAQGKTVDRVLVCQTRELSAAATNRDQYHVATTRGSKGMKTYTDDFEWLLDSASRIPERLMASELIMEESSEPLSPRDERLCELEKQQIEMARDLELGPKSILPEPVQLAKVLGKAQSPIKPIMQETEMKAIPRKQPYLEPQEQEMAMGMGM